MRDYIFKCPTCADGLGRCFGPNICCGPNLGCLLDTQETQECKVETADSSAPCLAYGKPCRSVEYGQCATSSLCCSSGKPQTIPY